MIGMIINEKERMELHYLMRRELEELLMDFGDPRLQGPIREAMEERYQIIFGMFARIANSSEILPYVRRPARTKAQNERKKS